MSDALDLCQLLYPAFMIRDSPVYCGPDLKIIQSQWRGSQWFQWTLDPSHIPGTLGCIPYTCELGACVLLDKVCFVCLTRCTALFSPHGIQQIKDPTGKSCSVRNSNLNFIKHCSVRVDSEIIIRIGSSWEVWICVSDSAEHNGVRG